MGLNDTVSAERIHIGFFGMRNAGKSSLVNAVTNQDVSVVSDVKGTTTDPVSKSMELLPLGAVVITDTPGIDDGGALGEKRVDKARQALRKTDIAVLVADAGRGLGEYDRDLISVMTERGLPFIIAYNKADLLDDTPDAARDNEIYVSALTGENIKELKDKIGALLRKTKPEKRIVGDIIQEGDLVVLVIPIDESAPKGRLILPQQQTIRDVLDSHCAVIACQDTELGKTLGMLSEKPKLIITDSQAFRRVAKETPEGVMLTSFSILFARYKGELDILAKGAAKLTSLNDGDKVLISEGCSHHRQCNDIGTVKLPARIAEFTGKRLEYTFTSGGTYPDDLSGYSLIVHCGGCMLNDKEMKHRINEAKKQNVPIVNYGIAIAHMHGILERSLKPFPDISKLNLTLK